MATAVVIHHNLNTPTGEETIALKTIPLLNDLGYDVHLVTIKNQT